MSHFKFKNANEAYCNMFNEIMLNGVVTNPRGLKCKELTNVLMEIENPIDRHIVEPKRNFKVKTGLAEFLWYMTFNPKVDIIGRHLKKWYDFSDDGLTVNSNYGYIWKNQVDGLIKTLKNDNDTRQAVITIYEGKIYNNLKTKDVPCTLNVHFKIIDDSLDMNVIMRSNDLVWGFCIDQFAFSLLQELIANELGLCVGKYYHYALNLHVYENKWDLLPNEISSSTNNILKTKFYHTDFLKDLHSEINMALSLPDANQIKDFMVWNCIESGIDIDYFVKHLIK